MIALFTDFGLHGPYMGQMKAVLHRDAPGLPVVDLFADAPAHNPRASAYLLAAYSRQPFPPGTVFLSVVDPDVGGARRPVALEADGSWFVGPDNGLFTLVARRATDLRWWEIRWRPEYLSASFHGRDLFAPVAARLALGQTGDLVKAKGVLRDDWPDDLPEIVYIDHFGNAVTGLRACTAPSDGRLVLRDTVLSRVRTFSDVRPGSPFWYENSNGLVEVAVNRDRADRALSICPGDTVRWE